MPVSYTHLDVYKRQGQGVAAEITGGEAKFAVAPPTRWVKPVSYTHLDVYKRQLPDLRRQ